MPYSSLKQTDYRHLHSPSLTFIIMSWCSIIIWAVNTIIFYSGITRLPDQCQMSENGSFYKATWAHISQPLHQRIDTDAVSKTLCSCLNMKQQKTNNLNVFYHCHTLSQLKHLGFFFKQCHFRKKRHSLQMVE